MAHQQSLFHERIEDALLAVIQACGGRKQFAVEMFGEAKTPRDAHNLLDAMLNPDRRERFNPEQLMYVARRGRAAGCHAVMEYLTRDAGYTCEPIEPEDQAAELQREFVDAVDRLTQIQQQLARLPPAAAKRGGGR
jgi:hypothetical protein